MSSVSILSVSSHSLSVGSVAHYLCRHWEQIVIAGRSPVQLLSEAVPKAFIFLLRLRTSGVHRDCKIKKLVIESGPRWQAPLGIQTSRKLTVCQCSVPTWGTVLIRLVLNLVYRTIPIKPTKLVLLWFEPSCIECSVKIIDRKGYYLPS